MNIKLKIKIICLFCKQEFFVSPSRYFRKYCKKSCFDKHESIIRRGKGNPMYGKKHPNYCPSRYKWSESEKRKIGARNKILIKKWWSNPKNKIKQLKAQRRGFEKRPTNPEKILIELIKENNLKFVYVGNGKKWIFDKGLFFNPDFINKKERIILELYGDYWHKRPEAIMRDQQRIEVYNKRGWKPIIIWEHELKNPEEVLAKLN